MRIHLASGQAMFRPQMQNPMQKLTGQQNSGLQKVIQQVNANYGSKRSLDTVELSKKAKELLSASKAKQAEKAKKNETPADYQKYPAGMFTQKEWAENALSAQRDGLKSVSDVIDYAKSKLKFTTSKIEELENYLSGTGTHSDPNMTKELAETYLHNYKQSLQHDFKEFLQSHIGPGSDQMFSKEYDDLSGGLASQMIENPLDSISAESLGLSNLSDDPQEMMEALENASKILAGLTQKVEDAYATLTGGKAFSEPARSTSIFDKNSSLDFFASQMEKNHRIVNTASVKFNGQTLRFQ